ncbi:ester hydrolase C11orf54 homolog [Halichondria panicea]|uniref:ester hydrolase C11orf54 homolog n=1 Tax=Halichondria panicea TaxID=6063 RepID=UPI00312BA58F
MIFRKMASPAVLPVESKSLHVPPLQEVAQVLQGGLESNFRDVSVCVVECPDLTQSPWRLAAPGICGSPRLVDIGGVPYLFPLPDCSKLYDMADIARLVGLPGAFLLGAGAGSSKVVGVNCEMVPNVRVEGGSAVAMNNTHIAKVNTKDGSIQQEKYDSVETGPLVNVLASEGKRGKVFEIKVKCRTGEENFVSCMRKALASCYGDKPVGMGGVFVISQGSAKLHVMPAFSEVPLTTSEDVNNWLKFYTVPGPLTCLSELISHDPGLDLRIDHTHCFSEHGEGGHYHYDTTPETIEYHGYYTLAESVYRVDRPENTHQLGRD